MVLVFFALFGREFLTSMCFSRGPQWGFAGYGLFWSRDSGLAPKLSRDTGFKYLRDAGLATKSSRDSGFKYLAGM